MTHLRFVTVLLVSTVVLPATAPAAVIFGTTGKGLRIGSVSYAEAKAPEHATARTDSKQDYPPEFTTMPIGTVSARSSASAQDIGTTDGVFAIYDARAQNSTEATFASAASGVINFAGVSSGQADRPGLARSNSGYFVEYVFTLTDANPFSLTYNYSSRNLGCCGSRIALDNLSSGLGVFGRTTYGADNNGTLTAQLQAGVYRLSINKNEYPGYDAPGFAGTSGSATFVHNDRVSFTIGSAPNAVPEPASWALMLAGFGLTGGAFRTRRSGTALA